jgi:leucyl aminopeptidase
MLSIEWTSQEAASAGHHLLAVAVASSDTGPAIERRFGAPLARAAHAARFRGEPGEKFSFLREHQGEPQQVLLLGTGASAPSSAAVRALAFDAVRAGSAAGVAEVVLDLRALGATGEPVHFGELVAQGLQLGTYRYDRYLSEAKRKPSTGPAWRGRVTWSMGQPTS